LLCYIAVILRSAGVEKPSFFRKECAMNKSHAGATKSARRITERPTEEQWSELHRQAAQGRFSGLLAQEIIRGNFAIREMKREEWIAREMDALKKFKKLGLSVSPDSDRVAGAWQRGNGVHDRYLPRGLGAPALLDACGAAGIKSYTYSSDSVSSGGETLPTDEGSITLALDKIMVPTNRQHHPFMLNFDQQVEWAQGEGGDGLTSVEETLYLLLRAWFEFNRMPFMGGWIRCRNAPDFNRSLAVVWSDSSLAVSSVSRSDARWDFGALPRQFRKVGD